MLTSILVCSAVYAALALGAAARRLARGRAGTRPALG
jgi:hypothetical protein